MSVLLKSILRQWRFLQIRGHADHGINERRGGGDAQRRANSRLQIEMLGIDADSGESGEHAACAAADRGSQYAFEPKFKSLHELNHRYKRLLVKRRDGVVHDVEGPVFVSALFPALASVELAFFW